MTTTRVFLEVEDDPASSTSSLTSPAMPTSSTREMFDVKEDSSPQTSTGSPSIITSAINEVEVQDDSTPQTSTVSSKNVTPGADTTGGLGGEDDDDGADVGGSAQCGEDTGDGDDDGG